MGGKSTLLTRMGANQSTRKITVVNDEAAGVIKISDAVVQRLRGEIAGEAPPAAAPPPPPAAAAAPAPADPAPLPSPPVVESAPEPAPAPAEPEAPPPPPAVVEAPAPPPSAPEAPAPPAPAAEAPQAVPQEQALPPQHIWQRPIIQYIEEPSLSALRVRTEKEEELLTLENYWKERLATQEAAKPCKDMSL